MEQLVSEIRALIVATLELEDVRPESIDLDDELFGTDDGLGLDSIDGLELGIALQKHYGIKIDEDDDELPTHFRTLRSLTSFVQEHRQ